MKIDWKTLLVCTMIPAVLGSLIALFLDVESYGAMIKPFLAPPKWVFPVVWTILYLLMGISSYFILKSKDGTEGLRWYILQLTVNLLWPLFFFNFKNYGLSFLWIILLILLVGKMIYEFYKVDKKAAYLQIPYFLWLIFAAYLNFAIYLLN